MTMPLRELFAGGRWIRLSHVLGPNTPAYGGGPGLPVERVRDMGAAIAVMRCDW